MSVSEKLLKTSEATQTTLVDKLKKTEEDKHDLKTKLQMLELKMANLEIIVKSFEQENTGLKLFVKDTSLRATDQDIMIRGLTAERDLLKHDLGKLMEEKQLLDAQLHQFEGNKINLQDKSSMLLTKTMQQDSQIWTLNCERNHLHQEVENLRATTSSLVKLEIQVQGLEREKSELRQRLNDSQIKLPILESQLAAVVAENDIIKKELEGWENKAKTTGMQKEQIEILKVEKIKFQQKLDIYNTKITEQDLNIKTLNAQKIDLQQELDELNSFITNLKNQPPHIEKEKVDLILKSNDSIYRLSVKESDQLKTGLAVDSTVPVNGTICLIEKLSDKNEYVKSLENDIITLKEDKEKLNSEITYLVYKLDATTYKNNELKSQLHQIRLKINGSNEGLKRAFEASIEQLEEIMSNPLPEVRLIFYATN
uniref:Uncharacterized protein n=1 Tax=Timema bartmani TaxID=61472 RepID=A0A7R9I6Y6_9NEOP|nr:unnamed protein product [Timema bartmani]